MIRPSSTKSQSGEGDPEMHRAKKGNDWYFGMKARIGVDAESGLTHTAVPTPANAHDVTHAHALLYGDETDVFGNAGYQGVAKRGENKAWGGDRARGSEAGQAQSAALYPAG